MAYLLFIIKNLLEALLIIFKYLALLWMAFLVIGLPLYYGILLVKEDIALGIGIIIMILLVFLATLIELSKGKRKHDR